MTTLQRPSLTRRLLSACAIAFVALSQYATNAHAQVVIGSQRTVETPVEWRRAARVRIDSATHQEMHGPARAGASMQPSFSVAMRGFFRRRGPRGARMGGGGMGQVGAVLHAPLFGASQRQAAQRR